MTDYGRDGAREPDDDAARLPDRAAGHRMRRRATRTDLRLWVEDTAVATTASAHDTIFNGAGKTEMRELTGRKVLRHHRLAPSA